MYIKTIDGDIIGVGPTSSILWKRSNCIDSSNTEIIIECDGKVLKRYNDSYTEDKNIQEAKNELLRIFEALKNNVHGYEMEA